MPTIREIKEERTTLANQMRAILDGADKVGRSLTGEETAEYERIESDLDAKGDEIKALETDKARREKLEGLNLDVPRGPSTDRGSLDTPKPTVAMPKDIAALSEQYPWLEERLSAGFDGGPPLDGQMVRERRAALRQFVREGTGNLTAQKMASLALQVDTFSAGGSMVVPEEFMAQLIKAIDNMVHIRGISTVLPMTNAESIGAPSLDADPADADWTVEIGTGSEDSTMATGKRVLTPRPVAKLLKISKTLLRKSAIPAENLVRDRLAYKFGVTEEKAFMTGTGAEQPLGVFTASALGISTSRDVSTANTTTALTADGLINAKYSLKAGYQMSPSTRWIFHRDAVKMIRKLKTTDLQYIWQAGLANDAGDMILDVPLLMSEYAPNTFTAALYVGIIGDFSYYWIAESLGFMLERLNELYAATNQVGFIGRQELDAMPVLEEAFARVQLAAS